MSLPILKGSTNMSLPVLKDCVGTQQGLSRCRYYQPQYATELNWTELYANVQMQSSESCNGRASRAATVTRRHLVAPLAPSHSLRWRSCKQLITCNRSTWRDVFVHVQTTHVRICCPVDADCTTPIKLVCTQETIGVFWEKCYLINNCLYRPVCWGSPWTQEYTYYDMQTLWQSDNMVQYIGPMMM